MDADLRAVQCLVQALLEAVKKLSSGDVPPPPLPSHSRSASRRKRRQATLRKLYSASLARGRVPASGDMASQCAMPDVVQVKSALPGCANPAPQLDACVATNVGIGLETSPDLKFVNCGDEAVFAHANCIPNRICDDDYGLPLPQLLPSCGFLTIADAGHAVAVSYLVYQAVHPAIAALVRENGGDTVQVSYSPEASGWVPMFGDSTLPDDAQQRIDVAPQPCGQECKQQ